uniref:Putative ovule protein n=2 Tax=Solanum chacoense TaxID=4108 RepID=A0A0V0GUJ3_SOLCH
MDRFPLFFYNKISCHQGPCFPFIIIAFFLGSSLKMYCEEWKNFLSIHNASHSASASPGLSPKCGLELIYFNSSLTTRSSFAVKDIS